MWTPTPLHFHYLLLLVLLFHAVGVQAVVNRAEASDVSEYDFIIIGGGTSGLAVADRLTEIDKVSVLVLEYGPLDRREASVLVPGLLNLTSTPYWFGLMSTPQRGLNNASFSVPSAAVVGGGSVINGMFFDRGAASDYDAWRDLGNLGWGWEDMLPYFKKSETFTPAPPNLAEEFNITFDASVHGRDGPVQSSYPVFQWANVANFLRAWRNLGLLSPKDPNGGTKAGVLYVPSTLDARNQSRSYSRLAHYDRVVEARPNYHLITEVAASKILFDGKIAVGVEYIDRKTNAPHHVKCKREVIPAAGAPHSPQILQLSGVGPADVLRSLDIPVIVDLPGVGFNLQDHPTLYSAFTLLNQPSPNLGDLTTNETYARQQLDLYYSERKGPYTIVNQGGNTIADLPLPYITGDYEDIIGHASDQVYASIYPGLDSSVLAGYDAQKTLVLEAYRSNTTSIQETGYNGGTVVPITLLKHLSRGSVLINSTSVFAAPLFDWGAMTFPTDLDILVASLRATRRMYADAAIQELGPVEVTPGAHLISDDELRAALRRLLQPTYSHLVGTCAMMPRERGGVVAPDLKVYGIQGLRVVDASIMPLIPSAHTSATVYAVAEKAVDMIKAEYGWAH